jgi:hypothetical protein
MRVTGLWFSSEATVMPLSSLVTLIGSFGKRALFVSLCAWDCGAVEANLLKFRLIYG